VSDRSSILDELLPYIDQDHAEGFIDHRKAMKRPLTAFGARLIAKELAKCQNPNEAIAEAILRGWQGFKAEWVSTKQSTPSSMFNDLARLYDAQSEREANRFEEPGASLLGLPSISRH